MITGDDILRKFWEIEEHPKDQSSLSPEEQFVVQHFKDNHCRNEEGKFVVSLPKKPHTKELVSQDHKRYDNFSPQRNVCAQRGNFKLLVLSWASISKWDMWN